MDALRLILILLIVVVPRSFSIETDQFAAWPHDLRDSSNVVEEYLRNSIHSVLVQANKQSTPPSQCSQIARLISNDLSQMSGAPFVTKIENWLMSSESVHFHTIGDSPWNSVQNSIYKGYWRFKMLPFASTINLYGIYLGVDKIGHFVDLGMSYYEKLLENLNKGKSYQQAIEVAIDYGILLEETIYGTLAALIFSYGDMEANYQGMKWFESLCTSGSHAHLQRNESTGKWHFNNEKKLSLKTFINPHWDESYYLNYYLPSMWKRVESTLVYKCLELDNPLLNRRFAYYQNFSESEHIKYLKKLERKNKVPKREFRYLTDYCFE